MYSLMSMPHHRVLVVEEELRQRLRESSVLPTPVGPRKMNEPIGRFSDPDSPARARRTALDTASTASS